MLSLELEERKNKNHENDKSDIYRRKIKVENLIHANSKLEKNRKNDDD